MAEGREACQKYTYIFHGHSLLYDRHLYAIHIKLVTSNNFLAVISQLKFEVFQDVRMEGGQVGTYTKVKAKGSGIDIQKIWDAVSVENPTWLVRTRFLAI
jgi:hypothetical protein